MQVKKRMRKTGEFWSVIGGDVGQPGECAEKLIKNLHSEFQRSQQQSRISGGETQAACLRGSEVLFHAFENYYQLYFPHGGSTVPFCIMTENSMTV